MNRDDHELIQAIYDNEEVEKGTDNLIYLCKRIIEDNSILYDNFYYSLSDEPDKNVAIIGENSEKSRLIEIAAFQGSFRMFLILFTYYFSELRYDKHLNNDVIKKIVGELERGGQDWEIREMIMWVVDSGTENAITS